MREDDGDLVCEILFERPEDFPLKNGKLIKICKMRDKEMHVKTPYEDLLCNYMQNISSLLYAVSCSLYDTEGILNVSVFNEMHSWIDDIKKNLANIEHELSFKTDLENA